jgi:hypothetical protein
MRYLFQKANAISFLNLVEFIFLPFFEKLSSTMNYLPYPICEWKHKDNLNFAQNKSSKTFQL